MNAQLDLFARAADLRWLPDETLYSLACRHHLLSLFVRPSQTLRSLFGIGGAHKLLDIPFNIEGLIERAGMNLGDWEQILSERTTIPWLLRFSCPARQASVFRFARAGPSKDGLAMTGKLRPLVPLGWCVRCAISDRLRFGVAYWHLQHQLPATLICLQHGCALSFRDSKGHLRLGLPPLNDSQPDPAPSSKQSGPVMFHKLAAASLALAQLPVRFQFDLGILSQTYLSGLDHHRLLSRSKCIDHARLLSLFSPPLRELSDTYLERVVSDPLQLSRGFARTLRSGTMRPNIHPLRHLLFILLIFGSWDQFMDSYKARAG